MGGFRNFKTSLQVKLFGLLFCLISLQFYCSSYNKGIYTIVKTFLGVNRQVLPLGPFPFCIFCTKRSLSFILWTAPSNVLASKPHELKSSVSSIFLWFQFCRQSLYNQLRPVVMQFAIKN